MTTRPSYTPSPAALRSAERLWGEKPVSAPDNPRLRLISGGSIVRGALRFIATIGLPFDGGELVIPGVMAFASRGKVWASLPSKPIIEGGQHRRDVSGKLQYTPALEWSTRQLSDRFSAAQRSSR